MLTCLVACTPAWQEYRDAPNGLSATLPGEPELESRKLDTAWGQVTLSSASVTLNESLRFWNRGFYGVAVGPLPEEAPEREVAAQACEAIAGSLGAVVTSDTPMKSGEYEGRDCELRASGPAGLIRARAIFARRRLYVAYVGGKGEARTVAAGGFFDSFRIVPDQH